jgi:hypothetical protein
MYGGFWKSQYRYSNTKISRSGSPMCFLRLNILRYSPNKETGAVHMKIFWREGYGRINGGARVLEPAADSREALLGEGARSTSISALEVEHTHPWGVARYQ